MIMNSIFLLQNLHFLRRILRLGIIQTYFLFIIQELHGKFDDRFKIKLGAG